MCYLLGGEMHPWQNKIKYKSLIQRPRANIKGLESSYCFLWKQDWKALTDTFLCLTFVSRAYNLEAVTQWNITQARDNCVCVFCFFSFVHEIKRDTSGSQSGAHYGQQPHDKQRIFFPTNFSLSNHRTKAGGSILCLYSLGQGFCPLLTCCLISHQGTFASWKIYILWNISLVISWGLRAPRRAGQFREGSESFPHRQGHTAPKWLLWRSRKPDMAVAGMLFKVTLACLPDYTSISVSLAPDPSQPLSHGRAQRLTTPGKLSVVAKGPAISFF